MKQHHFDIEHAAAYGVYEAIVINHFQFWIFNNRANGVNFHDGHFWSYNSVAALTETFSYWKPDQIRRTLERLVKADVLIKGMYAKKLDRSTWYAFADEDKFLGERSSSANMPNRERTRQKSQMSSANTPGEFGINAESSIYTDKNTDKNTDNAPPSAPQESTSSAVAVVAPKATNPVDQVFFHWQQVMQCPRAKLDTKRRTAVQARLKDGYTAADLMQAIDGCRNSDWHMGKNKDGKVFNDLELICRDAGKVDGFMAQTTRTPQAGSAGESLKEKNDRIMAQVMRGGPDSDLRTIDMEA
jgi:hypothetical protein